MQNYFNNLEESATSIHAGNVAKGFWEPRQSLPLSVALAIGELYEALEAARAGKTIADVNGFRDNLIELGIDPEQPDTTHPVYIDLFAATFRYTIKDTVADELADFVIRCLDLAKGHSFDFAGLQFFYNLTLADSKDRKYYSKVELAEFIIDVTDETASITLRQYEHKESWLAKALSMVNLYCQANEINLNWHIHYKLLYNSTRAAKHGKNF